MPHINLFSSSNTSYGAINKSTLGSQFSNNFPNPLKIPPNAKNIEVYCHSLGAFYTFPNISTSKNNNTIYLTTNTANYEQIPIVIPDGLYSVDLLTDAVNYQLNASGYPSGLITFEGDLATGRVITSITASGYALYFKTNKSPYTLLGFNAEQKVPATGLSTGTTFQATAPNTALFSELESLTLLCSLVNGAYNNGKVSNVLASIPIQVGAGQNIVYEPSNLIRIDAPQLQGATISDITFTLADQNLNPVDTAGEDWSVRVVITWD